jgi:hypothetical protein
LSGNGEAGRIANNAVDVKHNRRYASRLIFRRKIDMNWVRRRRIGG